MFSSLSRSLVLTVLLAGVVQAGTPASTQPDPFRVKVTAEPAAVSTAGDVVKLFFVANGPAPAGGANLSLKWELNGSTISGGTAVRIRAGSKTAETSVTLTKAGTPGPIKLKFTVPDGFVQEWTPFQLQSARPARR